MQLLMGTARTGHPRTSQRDWLRALEATSPVASQPKRLLFHVIEDLAQTSPDAPALISATESLTYAALAARANAYACWAIAQNIAEGEHRLPDAAEPAGSHGRLARA